MHYTPDDFHIIHDTLERAWTEETSGSSHWSEDNRPLGQCLVSTLIIQDYLGGSIMRSFVNDGDVKIGHYWNVFDNGEQVDITRSQFSDQAVFSEAEPRTREQAFEYPDVPERYEILKKRFGELAYPLAG